MEKVAREERPRRSSYDRRAIECMRASGGIHSRIVRDPVASRYVALYGVSAASR